MLTKKELEEWKEKDKKHLELYNKIFVLDFRKLFNVIEAGVEVGHSDPNWTAKELTQMSIINIIEQVLKEKI